MQLNQIHKLEASILTQSSEIDFDYIKISNIVLLEDIRKPNFIYSQNY